MINEQFMNGNAVEKRENDLERSKKRKENLLARYLESMEDYVILETKSLYKHSRLYLKSATQIGYNRRGGNNMTKSEFLAQLKKALQENLNSSAVQENMDYYNRYIIEETAKGKSEEEVISMLGDPWILARTITDASDGTDWETVYESGNGNTSSAYDERSYQQESRERNGLGVHTWVKIFLMILFVIMVLMLVISIISGVVSFFAPVLVPLLIVLFVVRLFSGRRS